MQPQASARQGWATEGLAPAVELACACCMWPPSEVRNERVRRAAERVDWAKFQRVVARQRIPGLAAEALRAAQVRPPPEIEDALNRAAQIAAGRSLALAAESLRLAAVLDEAGVEALFVKGTALAQLAYGTLALKHSRDIDLLVAPADAARALTVLEREGYLAVAPHGRFSARQLVLLLRLHKDIELRHPKLRLNVELHWRLVDNPVLLRGVDVGSPTQVAAVPGGRLTTLADAQLFAYLAVHGATHGWFRLKWLADLGAWLAGKTDTEVAGFHAEAERLGVEACAGQALRLCERLLGLAPPAELRPRLRSAKLRRLEAAALDAMAGGDGEIELGQRPFGQFRLLAPQFERGRGGRFLAAQIALLADSLDDRLEHPLPPALEFLYPLLRLPLWIARATRRRRARVATEATIRRPA
jgi:hypothetical protein